MIGQYTTDVIFFYGIIKATRVTFVCSLLHSSFFISHNLSLLSFSANSRIMSTSNSSLTPNTQPVDNPYKPTPNKRTKTGTTPVSISPDDTSGNTLGTSVGTPVGDKPLTSIKKRKDGPVQPRLTQLGFTSEGKGVRGCLYCLMKSWVYENVILTFRLYFLLLLLAATKEHREEDELCDPRGYRNGTKSVPYRYCQYCCCPRNKCHNQVYGKFCELMVVNAVAQEYGEPLTEDRVEEIHRTCYNWALQFMIFMHCGQLDVKVEGYDLPTCMRDDALESSFRYIKFRDYHFELHRDIMNGRDELMGGQAQFYDTEL
jgi:hypothetical protein